MVVTDIKNSLSLPHPKVKESLAFWNPKSLDFRSSETFSFWECSGIRSIPDRRSLDLISDIITKN